MKTTPRLCALGPGLATKYASLCASGGATRSDEYGCELPHMVLAWINDALRRLMDHRTEIRVPIPPYFQGTILPSVIRDYMRTREHEKLAAKLNRELRKPNEHVTTLEKSRASFFATWWSGAQWVGRDGIQRYHGSLYREHRPARMADALRASAQAPAARDTTDGELLRRYSLYLLELDRRKYLRFDSLHEVIDDELETVSLVLGDSLARRGADAGEGDPDWWQRPPDTSGFDPLVLRQDLESMRLSSVDRFILYQCCLGYTCEQAARRSTSYAQRPGARAGGPAPFAKSFAYKRWKEIETKLRGLGYCSGAAFDSIAAVLAPEFGDAVDWDR